MVIGQRYKSLIDVSNRRNNGAPASRARFAFPSRPPPSAFMGGVWEFKTLLISGDVVNLLRFRGQGTKGATLALFFERKRTRTAFLVFFAAG